MLNVAPLNGAYPGSSAHQGCWWQEEQQEEQQEQKQMEKQEQKQEKQQK